MIGLGFILAFGGYSLLAYGLSQVRGQNAGLVEMLWPQKNGFRPASPDEGSANPAPSAPSVTNPTPHNPITAPPPGSNGVVRDTTFPTGRI